MTDPIFRQKYHERLKKLFKEPGLSQAIPSEKFLELIASNQYTDIDLINLLKERDAYLKSAQDIEKDFRKEQEKNAN